ncbi:MAG TPA: S8 family serine peptidase [Acidobacteriota bacterium]|nr:S8 family serine peptidase [Acidobacteriota bacterium]
MRLLRQLASLTVVLCVGLAPIWADRTEGAAGVPDYVRPRSNPVISPWAARVIEQTTRDNRTRIWVFFTDKGFGDRVGFEAARVARGVQLAPRAAARRAKIGRDRVEFIDVPVHAGYVERVAATGATLRQTSRWLNGASFEVDVDGIAAIAALPFVSSIRPMIGSERVPVPSPVELEEDVEPIPSEQEAATVLNYGLSLGQLDQINVPAAHTLGYKGQGVLVGMLDTGFRKDHIAFAQIIAEGRLIADSDFVFGDGETQDDEYDIPGSHNHGTYTWSALAGESDGSLYGPAYGAEFLLAKTEDSRSETPIEEDYWVAGIEWADGLGVDVISSSVAYIDWYTYDDLNGDIAVTTVAADIAASLGIIVCNSIANSGPDPGTLHAPADADSVIAVGAVYSNGYIAAFSSRGPTRDGRIKPEVCAQGVSTSCAYAGNTTGFTTQSGTSMSCPLVAGAAAVVLSAHPDWTAMEVRDALMQTASQADAPDNNYGWGIVDVIAAINRECTTAPATPGAPTTSNPTPCDGWNYTISWAPIPFATQYQLFENDDLIYEGSAVKAIRNHSSGTYIYYVVAGNDCGTSAAGPTGALSTIRYAPDAPAAPTTSDASPCYTDLYTVSWLSVADAFAYELYENSILVYAGSDTEATFIRATGSFTYKVAAMNVCGTGATSPAGAVTTIRDCACHGDPVCDGVTNVLDVVSVVNEAFRGGDPIVDPTCTHVSRNDVNCDCVVSILDVVLVVNVAFRGADPAATFCDPCTETCP